jgi:drug/metabolite transporter (DMT)-like permease
MRGYSLAAALSLALAMTLVGGNVPLGRTIVATIPPMTLTALRCGLAWVILVCAARLLREPVMRAAPSVDRAILAQALIGVFAFNVLLLAGLRLTSAVEAGLITSTLPAMTALCAIAILRERPTHRVWAGIVLAGIGLIVVNTAGVSSGAGSLLGNALVLLAMLAEGVFIVAARHSATALPPLRMAARANGTAFFPLVVCAFLFEAPFASFAAASAMTWLGVIYFTVSGAVIAYVLWFRGLREIPASHAGVFTVFMPLAAVAAGALALGEPVGAARALGFAILLASVLITTWPARS